MTAWLASDYGEQNAGTQLDMWGVAKDKIAEGWYVPSRAEWCAFAVEMGITTSNYRSKGLKQTFYWTSSLASSTYAKIGYVSFGGVNSYGFAQTGGGVRLGTNF